MFETIINAIAKFGLDHNGVAQMAHGLAGALFLLVAAYSLNLWWLGAILLVIWATGKEFWIDITYEKQSFVDAFYDWFFYLVGGLVGSFLVFLHG